MMNRFCSACGIQQSPEHSFCTKCGSKLQILHQCMKCKVEIDDEIDFCTQCGFPTNNSSKSTVSDDSSRTKDSEPGYSKNIKKIVFILLGIGFLIYLVLGGSFGTPTCEKIASGFSAYDGWHWGRPDRLPGYCNLPNSNEKIYYSN